MTSKEDKVIQFPGQHNEPESTDASPIGSGKVGIPGMSEDQEKAFQIAVDGMSFVMIGIKPTDSGADFFTALHGDREELLNAQPHLEGVINRAFERRGL